MPKKKEASFNFLCGGCTTLYKAPEGTSECPYCGNKPQQIKVRELLEWFEIFKAAARKKKEGVKQDGKTEAY